MHLGGRRGDHSARDVDARGETEQRAVNGAGPVDEYRYGIFFILLAVPTIVIVIFILHTARAVAMGDC